MAKTSGFPRIVRLLKPGDYARVYAARQSAASGPLVLYACPSVGGTGAAEAGEARPPRLGVSVSRRIGNAVVRNRWKRRLREAVRGARPRLPAGNDLVIVVRSSAVPAGAAGARQVEEWLVSLTARVVRRPAYAAAGRHVPVGPVPPRRRG